MKKKNPIKHNRLRILALFACGIVLSPTLSAQNYQEWIEKSFDHLDSSRLDSASYCLQEAMRQEPANPINFALLTNLGTLQRQQGKLSEALASYTAALSRQPDNSGLLENRASLLVEMGKNEIAIGDYNVLIELEPAKEDYRYFRGLLHLEMGNWAEAEADFNRILEVNDKTIRGRIGFALLEKAKGNYDESEKIYSYLIDKRPEDWNLYEGRADLYYAMGKNARAMADINKIFNESEPTAFLYVLRGKIKLKQFEKEAAIKDFTRAVELGYDEKVLQALVKEE